MLTETFSFFFFFDDCSQLFEMIHSGRNRLLILPLFVFTMNEKLHLCSVGFFQPIRFFDEKQNFSKNE